MEPLVKANPTPHHTTMGGSDVTNPRVVMDGDLSGVGMQGVVGVVLHSR